MSPARSYPHHGVHLSLISYRRHGLKPPDTTAPPCSPALALDLLPCLRFTPWPLLSRAPAPNAGHRFSHLRPQASSVARPSFSPVVHLAKPPALTASGFLCVVLRRVFLACDSCSLAMAWMATVSVSLLASTKPGLTVTFPGRARFLPAQDAADLVPDSSSPPCSSALVAVEQHAAPAQPRPRRRPPRRGSPLPSPLALFVLGEMPKQLTVLLFTAAVDIVRTAYSTNCLNRWTTCTIRLFDELPKPVDNMYNSSPIPLGCSVVIFSPVF